jgi:hypothetical protein
MASNKYSAHYVDLFSVPLANYALAAMDDEAAKLEARQLLAIHPSMEVGMVRDGSLASSARNIRRSKGIEAVGPVLQGSIASITNLSPCGALVFGV